MLKTILVIEDDIDILDMVEAILTFNEFHFVGFDRANNILDLIIEHRPALVLTDYMLPGLKGNEISQLIKENHSTKHIPVILMSAIDKMDISCVNYKYDAYVSKPFDMNHLVKTIHRLTN